VAGCHSRSIYCHEQLLGVMDYVAAILTALIAVLLVTFFPDSACFYFSSHGDIVLVASFMERTAFCVIFIRDFKQSAHDLVIEPMRACKLLSKVMVWPLVHSLA